MSPEEQPKKPRSERLHKQRLLCCDHATDLIESAERVLSGDRPIPNVSFHLVLLALEEIGKAELLTAREVSIGNRNVNWIDKRLDDHAFKLLWGLWSPDFSASREVDPEKFRQLGEFSQHAHQQRLAALYVGTDSNAEGVSAPKDAVTLEEVTSLLAVAKQNLQRVLAEDSPDVEAPNELMQWFWDVIADADLQQRLFSAPFIAKYTEFNGDARAWIQWAKEEFEKIKQQEQALLAAELNRVVEKGVPHKERWRMKMRVYCISHSIRANVLKAWNDGLPTARLHFVNNGELLLELTVSDQFKISEMQPAGQAMSKLILAALNAGTAGYFWHERPQTSTEYFEKVEDLENPNMKIKSSGGFDLQRNWRSADKGGKLTLLDQKFLDNAVKCALMFLQMREEEAEPIFRPYLTGLTMRGKSDAFFSLDQQTVQAFHVALEHALRHFGDWDGIGESFIRTLHKVYAELIPEEEHRNIMFQHLLKAPQNPEQMQEWAVSAKRLVDLYLTMAAHRVWQETIAKANNVKNSPGTSAK
jgi:AbiV family abortive infection protein